MSRGKGSMWRERPHVWGGAIMLMWVAAGSGFAPLVNAGTLTPSFQVVRITHWSGGQFKIYTDQPSINGLEGCGATDASLGVAGDVVAKEQFLSIALAARASGLPLHSWVDGCCVSHNGKLSPCVSTLSVN